MCVLLVSMICLWTRKYFMYARYIIIQRDWLYLFYVQMFFKVKPLVEVLNAF